MDPSTLSLIAFVAGVGILGIWILTHLLFFNSLMGTFLSKLLYHWVFKRRNTYFRVSSVSLALLGGKILFKDLQYTTRDYSLRVLDGNVAVVWWLLWKKKWNGELESRLRVRLDGVELLVYNNSSKYDRVRHLQHQRSNQTINMHNGNGDDNDGDVDVASGNGNGGDPRFAMDEPSRKRLLQSQDSLQTLFGWAKSVAIDVSRFSVVIGNHFLPSLVSISQKRLTGLARLEKGSSALDIYRLSVDVKMDDAIVYIHKNPLATASDDTTPEHHQHRYKVGEDSFDLVHRHFKTAFKDVVHFRFLDEENLASDYDEASFHERIKIPYSHRHPQNYQEDKHIVRDETKIFRSTDIRINYHYDKPGVVPGRDSEDYVNLASEQYKPPENGIDIHFGKMEHDAVSYGPWADHQRSIIQSFFFPNMFEDAKAIARRYGYLRPYETFDIKLTFDQDTKWLFPLKRTPCSLHEKKSHKGDPDLVTLHMGAESTVNWSSPQGCFELPSELPERESISRNNYTTKIAIDMKNVRMHMSNSESMMGCANLMECRFDLQNAKAWNGLRKWSFNFDLHSTQLFYLADHLQIMKDLIRDWSNYPNRRRPTLKEFVPSKVEYNFRFRKIDIFLHSNNYNIIDHPNDLNKNIFFHVATPILDVNYNSESLTFSPSFYKYNFDVSLESSPSHQPYANVSWPSSHPLAQRMGKDSQRFLSGDRLRVYGHYYIHSSIRSDKMDTIQLNVDVKHADVLLSGYNFNHLICMWYNYFTVQKSFETSEEFKLNGYKNDKSKQFWFLNSTTEDNFFFPSNPTEYIVEINFDRGRVLVPPNLYTATTHEMGYIMSDHVQLEIRYVPEYISICLDVSPIVVDIPLLDMASTSTGREVPRRRTSQRNNIKFIGVDKVNLWAQLSTGPPPDGNYYKMALRINFGDVIGEMHPFQIGQLLTVAQNLAKQWTSAYPSDPNLDQPPVYTNRIYTPSEVSKWRVLDIGLDVQHVSVNIMDQQGVLHAQLKEGVSFAFNTLNHGQSNKRMHISVPHVEVKFLTHKGMRVGNETDGEWVNVGRIDLGLDMQIRDQYPTLLLDQRKQQQFLADHSVLQKEFWDSDCQTIPIYAGTSFGLYDMPHTDQFDIRSSSSHKLDDNNPNDETANTGRNDKREAQDAVEDDCIVLLPSAAPDEENRISFTDTESFYETAQSDYDSALSALTTQSTNSDYDDDDDDDDGDDYNNAVDMGVPVQLYDISRVAGNPNITQASEEKVGDESHQAQKSMLIHPTGTSTSKESTLMEHYADQFVSTLQGSYCDGDSAIYYNYEDSDDEDDLNETTMFTYQSRKSIWRQHASYGTYNKYLNTYVFDREYPVLSPLSLRFNQLYQVPFAMGMRSPFPVVRLRKLNESDSQIPRFFDTEDQPSQDTERFIYRESAEDDHFASFDTFSESHTSEQTAQKNIHLDFVRDIDVLVTPDIPLILSSLLKSVLFPLVNLVDTADLIERDIVVDPAMSSVDKTVKASEKPPTWSFSKMIISCSLHKVSVNLIQTIRPFAVLDRSPILGRTTSTTLRFVSEHINIAGSFTFRYAPDEEVSKPQNPTASAGSDNVEPKSATSYKRFLHEIDLVFKAKTNQISLQCLNRSIKSFHGVSTLDLSPDTTRHLLEGRPVIALISFGDFDLVAKYDHREAADSQARLIFDAPVGISARFVQEIPAVAYAIFMLWKDCVSDLTTHIKQISRMKTLYKLTLLHGLSQYHENRSEKTDGSHEMGNSRTEAKPRSSRRKLLRNSNRASSLQRQFRIDESLSVLNFHPLSKNDALIRMRKVLNGLSEDRLQYIQSILPTWSNVEKISESDIYKQIGTQFVSLIDDIESTSQSLDLGTESFKQQQGGEEEEEKQRKTGFKKIQADISLHMQQITIALHGGVNEERKLLTKSIARIENIKAKARVDEGHVLDNCREGWDPLSGRLLSAKKIIRQTDVMAFLTIGKSSADIHPDIVSLFTCAIGVGLTLKTRNMEFKGREALRQRLKKIAETPREMLHIRSKTVANWTSSSFAALQKRTESLSINVDDDDDDDDDEPGTAFVTGDQSSHGRSSASRSSQRNSSKQQTTSMRRNFRIFAQTSLERIEARAWTDQYNFAELNFDHISISFNQPLNTETIAMELNRPEGSQTTFPAAKTMGMKTSNPNADTDNTSTSEQPSSNAKYGNVQGKHMLKFVHGVNFSITKIQFQYNYAPRLEEKSDTAHYVSLLDANVSGVHASEFWFHDNGKPHVTVTAGFNDLGIHIPFTDVWSAASMQFRTFVIAWYRAITTKPHADISMVPDFPPYSERLTSRKSARFSHRPRWSEEDDVSHEELPHEPRQPKKPNTSSLLGNIPSINLTLDLQSMSCIFNVLPQLQMRYMIKRIVASYNQQSTTKSTFHLHAYPHSIAFKTNIQEPFPDIDDKWNTENTTNSRHGTKYLEPQHFNRQFVLPEIFVSGDTEVRMHGSTAQKSRYVKTSVTVGHMENVVTSGILNHLIYLQSTMTSEIEKVIKVVKATVEEKGKDLTKKIKSEFPKAQASVSSLNLQISVDVLLAGFRLIGLGTSAAVVADTGSVKFKVENRSSRSVKELKWDVSLENMTIEMIDTYRIKWGQERTRWGTTFSNKDDCYRWASFQTNVHAYNQGENKQNRSNGASSADTATVRTSNKLIRIEIHDTHIYLRPGCIDQASLMFKDYLEAFSNLKQHVRKNKEHMNTEAISSLMKTGEEYYTFYLKQIVEEVAKDPTLFFQSIKLHVFNTTLCMPIGDNPYYGFLIRRKSIFVPTSALQVLVNTIDATVLLQSTKDITASHDMPAEANVDHGNSKQIGSCRIGNVCLYFEELPKECSENRHLRGIIYSQSIAPTLEKFASTPNRIRIANSSMSVEFTSTRKGLQGMGTIKVSGPEIHGTSSIITHVLHLRNDWLNPKRVYYRGSLQFSQISGNRQEGSSEDENMTKIIPQAQSVASLLFERSVHIVFMATVEPGVITMRHDLMLKNSTRQEKTHTTPIDSGIAIETDLPQFVVDFVHRTPPSKKRRRLPTNARQSDKPSTNRSNTHMQVLVHWPGAFLSPQVLFLVEEMVYLLRKFEREEKHLRETAQAMNSFDDSIYCKPLKWMYLMKAVILIQKNFRGYRARRHFVKLKTEKRTKGSTSLNSEFSANPSTSKDKTSQLHSKKDSQASLLTDTISFLCRIDPFKVQLLCAPASEIVFSMEFSEPFDLLFTRTFRSVKIGAVLGDAIYNTVFLSSPVIIFRVYQKLLLDPLVDHPQLSIMDSARLTISGIRANLGIGLGRFLRADDSSVWSGTIHVERVKVTGDLTKLNEFFIMYAVFMEKHDEAQSTIREMNLEPGTHEETGGAQSNGIAVAKTGRKKRQVKEELTLDSTSSHFGQMFVSEVVIQLDLSNAVGTQDMNIKSLSLFVRDRGRFKNASTRDPMHIGGYIGEVDTKLSGRLSGHFTMDGIAFGANRYFKSSGKKPIMRGKTDLSVKVQPITLSLDYNNSSILSLEMGQLVAKFRDKFDTPDGRLFRVQSVFTSDGITVSVSRLTVPSLLILFHKLKEKIKERYSAALETLHTSTHYQNVSRSQQQPKESGLESGKLDIKALNVKNPLNQFLDTVPKGEITILGRNLTVFMYDRFHRRSISSRTPVGDWIEFAMGNYKLILNRSARPISTKTQLPTESIERLLTLFLAHVAVNRSAKGVILKVPGALVAMNSSQRCDVPQVITYTFDSEFPDPIRVTTNLNEYSILHALINVYTNEMKKELDIANMRSKTRDNATKSLLSNSNGADATEKTNVNDKLLSSSSGSIAETMNPLHHADRTYRGKMELNPKLNVLGDMTPKVETVLKWLGIKDKDVIPRHTHDQVTGAMETLLISCYNFGEICNNVLEEK